MQHLCTTSSSPPPSLCLCITVVIASGKECVFWANMNLAYQEDMCKTSSNILYSENEILYSPGLTVSSFELHSQLSLLVLRLK